MLGNERDDLCGGIDQHLPTPPKLSLKASHERVPRGRDGDVAGFEDVLDEVLAEAGGAAGYEEDARHAGCVVLEAWDVRDVDCNDRWLLRGWGSTVAVISDVCASWVPYLDYVGVMSVFTHVMTRG